MKMTRRLTRLMLLPLAAGAIAYAASAMAADFPSKPIEVINNSKPGGGTDVFLRFATEETAKILGTDMLVMSKTGGVATNALKYVASKPRDGHTVFSLLPGHLLTILRGTTDMSFDDIVPVVRGTIDPEYVAVKADGFATMKDLIEESKKRAIKIGGTKVGGNAHIASLLFARKAGLEKMVYVPFQKSGEIAINLVSGRIDVSLLNYSEIESQVASGGAKLLAVLQPNRLDNTPDVPTGHEVGVPFNAATIRGIGVLKGTPEPVIAKLEKAFLEGMNTPGYLKYLEGAGQTSASVAGREEWTAQIKELFANYQEMGEELKLLKK